MTRRRPRVVILGGGMAGLAAAWRLSAPGWRDEFESVTVFQRGWRLGGKGASSRGPHGRIEEHGLHVWMGHYENAFRLLRECYEELDRPTSDPACPVGTWRQGFVTSDGIGLADRRDGPWRVWFSDMPRNERVPGEPGASGRDLTAVQFLLQALQLVSSHYDSVSLGEPTSGLEKLRAVAEGLTVSVASLVGEVARAADRRRGAASTGNGGLGGPWAGAAPTGLQRTGPGVALMATALRGIVADGLLTDRRRLRAINDEDYVGWVARHGGSAGLGDYPIVRGMYDLVFGYEDGDPARPAFGAGTAVLFGGKSLFDYRGSFMWKMTAGMGEIVFAPLYQALRQRGVDVEFFHRVDGLHPSKDGHRIEAITVGRQVRLGPDRSHYDPLVSYGGLPAFPGAPRVEQLSGAEGIEGHPLEAHWCRWPDAERRVLRDGEDYDLVVFAIPPGMAKFVCADLVADRPEWAEMVGGVATVATQSLQLWLREPEEALGWAHPGATVSAFQPPFSTWSSMPQLLDIEDFPAAERPGSIAYFCGPLDAPVPDDALDAERAHERVRQNARRFVEQDLGHLLPGVGHGDGFRWDLLCGAGEGTGPGRLDSQYWRANVDPSDRYVQSLPGTDRYRLRSDESGYDNLFLAGDWTDSGFNTGSIEAAVLSGLQAANAVRGRPCDDRVLGYFMP